MSEPATVPLLLDEMFAPVVAEALRDKGYDVVAVVAEAGLRALSDDEVYAWAAAQGRCLVTENVKDFRPILTRAEDVGGPVAALLFTSSRTFPRVRRNPGPLIDALDTWLRATGPTPVSVEQWMQPAR
jgi:predicted nuclease of predicted toxin-antitoxin system